jgi:hypothetical protein
MAPSTSWLRPAITRAFTPSPVVNSGNYATYFIAGWALWSTFRTWIKNQTLLNAAFLVLCVMVIVRANTETDLAVEFSGTAVLLFIGAVRKEKLRPRRARMPTPPVAPERGQAVPPQP